LIEREAQHRWAIGQRDWAAVAEMLTPDMTYTHTTGVTQSRKAYLAALPATTPRTQTRGHLTIRIYGSVCVLSGRLFNTKGALPDEQELLQVWIDQDGTWMLAASQATRVATRIPSPAAAGEG
jgi:hypothetical protein